MIKWLSLEKYILIGIILTYFMLLFMPAYYMLYHMNQLFGWDIGEYILTAKCYFKNCENIYVYPYPGVPLIYIPLVLWSNSDPINLIKIGNLISVFLVTFTFIVILKLAHDITKNMLISVIGALFFGFYPLWLDVIGWGGQATMLAMLFGVIAWINLYSFDVKKDNFIKLIIVSAFLLLSLISEPYIFIHFALSSVLFLVIYGLHLHKKFLEIILKVFIISSLPIIMIVYFYSTIYHHAINIVTPPVYQFIGAEVFQMLASRLTFDRSYLLYFLVFIFIMLFINLDKKFIKFMSFLTAQFLATALQCLLFTPFQYLDRCLHPFLLFIAFTNVFVLYSYFSKLKKSIIITAPILISSIFIFIFLSIEGLSIYRNALSFYSIDTELLKSVFQFSRFIHGNIIFISDKSYTFSLAFVSGKDIYPTQQPVWYIKPSQVNATIFAHLCANGVTWIDNGEVKIGTTAPLVKDSRIVVIVTKYPYAVNLYSFYLNSINISNISLGTNRDELLLSYITSAGKIINNIRILSSDSVGHIRLSYTFNLSYIPEVLKLKLVIERPKVIGINITKYNTYPNISEIEIAQVYKEPWYPHYYLSRIFISIWPNSTKFAVKYLNSSSEIYFMLYPVDDIRNLTISFDVFINNIKINPPRVTTCDSFISGNDIRLIIIDKTCCAYAINLFNSHPNFTILSDLSNYIFFVRR
jgi:hypothetical protein